MIYESFTTPRALSIYGASDIGEAFTKGISEANTSLNPRPLAVAINNRYLQYKSKMNGGPY